MSANVGTKEKLLGIVDDIEDLSKALIGNFLIPKNQRLTPEEHVQIAELLVQKDQELKDTLKTADEQAELQKQIDDLQAEVEKQDQDINKLQTHLKQAEHLLATAVYQARQKIQSISKANERSVSSEELIKYAHRISSSNAVAAPHNWQPGDSRRPYPTDIEMRLGFLGRLSDLPLTGSVVQHQQQGSLSELSASRGPHGEQTPSQAATFSWQASSDIKPQIPTSANHCVPMDAKSHNKDNEDVEVMSTDSSSSSSSDSQ